MQSGRVPPDLLDRATQAAIKYPNDHDLLSHLAQAYYWGQQPYADCDMAASIRLAMLQNRYLLGAGDRSVARRSLSWTMQYLGHHDIAASVLLPKIAWVALAGWPEDAKWEARIAAPALMAMGRYGLAAECYHWAGEELAGNKAGRLHMIAEEGIATALAGNRARLEKIIRRRRDELTASKMIHVLEAYRDVLAGKEVNVAAVERNARSKHWWTGRHVTIFCVQMDLMAGRDARRGELTRMLAREPNYRPLWILFDLYDRRATRPESACLYDSLEWLYSRDPWVKAAVADSRQRHPKPQWPRPQDLLEKLKDFTPVRRPERDKSATGRAKAVLKTLAPGSVASAVRRLIERKEFDTARELALRYLHMAVDRDQYQVMVRANHLVHRVEQVRKKPRPRPTSAPGR